MRANSVAKISARKKRKTVTLADIRRAKARREVCAREKWSSSFEQGE
jgi:hypothetical protein